MPNVFAEFTIHGLIGSESDDMVLYYRADALLSTDVTSGELTDLCTHWRNNNRPALRDVQVNDWVLASVSAFGYNSSGFPSLALPVSQVDGSVGVRAEAHDGKALTVAVLPEMTELVVLGSDPSPFRRSYLAFGPLINDAVGEDGAFSSGAYLQWAAFLLMLGDTVAVPLGLTWIPVRASFVSNHLTTPNIVSYRDAPVWNNRLSTSFRRSRLNGR